MFTFHERTGLLTLIFAAACLGAGYGYSAGGIAGGLSGAIAGLTIVASAAFAMGRLRAAPSITARGAGQRFIGLFTCVGAIVGFHLGGWHLGWLTSILGYGVGLVVALPICAAMGGLSVGQAAQDFKEFNERLDQLSAIEMTGRQIFNRVVSLSSGTVTLLIVTALLIEFLSKRWPLLGKVGMWVYVAFVVFTGLHVLIGVLLPRVVSWYLLLMRKHTEPDEGWLSLSTLVRIIEVTIGVAGVGFVAAANGYLR